MVLPPEPLQSCSQFNSATTNSHSLPRVLPHCSRMESSISHPSCQSKSVLVLSPVPLLTKRGQFGELVLPSLPPPGWRRRREREEMVCCTGSALTGRKIRPAEAGPKWSEGEGRGREWQNSPSIKVEGSVCLEPNLKIDSDMEPETEGMQETENT